MQRVVERTLDPWEGYRQIVGVFQQHAHLQMPELRAFVRIDDIDPNGTASVTSELRDTISPCKRLLLQLTKVGY